MDIEKALIAEGTENYKCYDFLKTQLKDSRFYEYVKKGLEEGLVFGFPNDLWTKIGDLNWYGNLDSIEEFSTGNNIGNCANESEMVSYCFRNCYVCGGELPLLVGTKNSPDGRHSWISKDGYVIDTSLMLIIEEKYSKELGYNEQVRINPNLNNIYSARKEFVNDKTLVGSKHHI